MPAPTARLRRSRPEPHGGSSVAAFPWITIAVGGASLLASLLPGWADSLQYDRDAVSGGQAWRLLTGQLVHWSARMTFVDLGMLTALGLWVERRSRALLGATLVGAAALVAAGVQLHAREVAVYRGSSGLAAAVFTVVALVLLGDGRHGWVRRLLGGLALLALLAKTAWEMRTGAVLAVGPLPRQVYVAPVVHLAGMLAGFAVTAARALIGRRLGGRA